MPFTISHAAAVVPIHWLRRRWLPLSALVVGSMAPDFGYLVPVPGLKLFGHTWLGVPAFCLPIGLAVLLLFHYVLKRPVVLLLPSAHRDRLMPLTASPRNGRLRAAALAVPAMLLGAFTHVLWDSVTHRTGWAAKRIPTLRETVTTVFGAPLKVHTILQHGSTVLGLALLALWYLRWYRKTLPQSATDGPLPRRHCLAILATFAVTSIGAGALAAFSAASPLAGIRSFQVFVVRFVVGVMVGLGAGVLAYSTAFLGFEGRPRNRATS